MTITFDLVVRVQWYQFYIILHLIIYICENNLVRRKK